MRSSISGAGLVFILTACSQPTPMQGDGWRQAGGLDGDMIPFVEVQTNRAKDGSVYRDALNHLCGAGRCMQVGFFEAGDAIPPSGRRSRFFRNGGWGNYRPIAVYMGGEFTQWDCDRAGEEAAPLSALCGEGAEEQYEAVLHVATRDGWTKACGLTPFGGRMVVEEYVASLTRTRAQQMLAAYEDMLSSSSRGPDDPSDCQTLGVNIEEHADEGKAVLKSAVKKSKAVTG